MDLLFRGFWSLRHLFGGGAAKAAAATLAFAGVTISTQPSHVEVSGMLKGAAPPAVTRLIVAGAPMTLQFAGHFEPEDAAVQSFAWRQSVSYDALTRLFAVQQDRKQVWVGKAQPEAIRRWSHFAVTVPTTAWGSAALDIAATLHYPGSRFGSRSVDVGALWDFRKPYVRIRNIPLKGHRP